MSCKEYEQRIIEYALGELETGNSAEIRTHIEMCAHCKSVYDNYACIVDKIESALEPCPNLAESEALSRALIQISIPEQKAAMPVPKGLPAMILGSVLVFLAMAGILALQVFGCINIAAIAREIGPVNIALAIVLIMFITSFMPIAAMVRRRPLNGMTFRR